MVYVSASALNYFILRRSFISQPVGLPYVLWSQPPSMGSKLLHIREVCAVDFSFGMDARS